VKFFRVFITILTIALVGGAVYLFLETEKLNYKLDDVKQSSETSYSAWMEQSNCLEEPQPCAAYSEQFENWLSQLKQYKERKENTPQFKGYFFLKKLDEMYVPKLSSGGLLSLAVICTSLLFFVLLIVYLSGGEKKSKSMSIKTKVQLQTARIPKPDTQALLRIATQCAESEPTQAISYLEQAIAGSLSAKLSIPALLLCGSLRLKNKIGEAQGREYLQKIISISPQSPEAEKAQNILVTYK
jgi:hypothetical protein